ncbi:unnamed protein product [Owenia fusiformis]|uniref:Uncharacterized protein n=1 Tax=Owenia fusiformis TaxID=6347 RepID=A0A8S4Q9Q2_OWEFU|nr:unnamed protein product [Owenia fusiformis]
MGIFIALNLASSVLVVCGLGKLRYDTDNSDNGENEPLLQGSTDGNEEYQTKEHHESFENISGHFKVKSDDNNDDQVQFIRNTDNIISSYSHDRQKNENCRNKYKDIKDKDTPSNITKTAYAKKSWSKRLRPDTLIGTFRVMVDLKMTLLIPLSVVNGCIISYSSAEFPQVISIVIVLNSLS